MNDLAIIGNLTRDPELRTVNTGKGPVAVCSFTVAVNRRGGSNGADYFNVSAWRGLGESCARYLTKGRKVYVSGPVSCRAYTDKSSQPHAVMEINASEVEFLSPKDQQPAQTVTGQDDFTPVDDDDTPF